MAGSSRLPMAGLAKMNDDQLSRNGKLKIDEREEGDEEPEDGGVDIDDTAYDEHYITVEHEDEITKNIKQRYQLSTLEAFWLSYEEDGKENLDLDDEKVCEMIGLGYLAFKEFGEMVDVPPKEVLKAARDEYRRSQAAAGSVERTLAFRTWDLQMTTGARKPPRVDMLPSLYQLDEESRKKSQQKEKLQRKESGQ